MKGVTAAVHTVPRTSAAVNDARWSVCMQWHDLLFAHWPVPAAALRPLVPESLDIETFDGDAWIGIVPFRMAGVRLRRWPPVPGTVRFPELNVRTYVVPGAGSAAGEHRPGVWFFSLDAASNLVVRVARAWYGLPYHRARMRAEPVLAGREHIRYTSARAGSPRGQAELDVTYGPAGPTYRSHAGTLEHFLTERYCIYALRAGRLHAADVHHVPWPLQPAEAAFRTNTMTVPLGVQLPDTPPLLHYAARLDVLAWRPGPV